MRGLLLHGFKCGFWFSLEHLPYFCQTEIFYSFHRSWGCLRRIVKLAFWFSLENYITLPQTELLLPFWASFIRVFLCLHGLNQHFNSVWRIMLSNIPALFVTSSPHSLSSPSDSFSRRMPLLVHPYRSWCLHLLRRLMSNLRFNPVCWLPCISVKLNFFVPSRFLDRSCTLWT